MRNLLNGILIIAMLFSCQLSSEKKTENSKLMDSARETFEYSSNSRQVTLEFEIIAKEDISYAGNPRMVYRIILNVDSIPTESEIKNTAIDIWENGNKNWKEFTVFIYLPEMNTDYAAYGIGEFNENGLLSFHTYESTLTDTKWEIKKTIEPPKQVQVASIKVYSVSITASNEGNRRLKITVNTNFPDGTNLLLSIGRTHFLKGSNEAYSGGILSEYFSVKNGKIESTVTVDDSEWYNEHIRLVKALPNDIQPISRISDNITISVLYTGAKEQPSNVVKILGKRGEYVTGEGVEKFGTGTAGKITSMRVEKELYFPFEK